MFGQPNRYARMLMVIFIIALSVRAVHLWQVSQSPFIVVTMGDAIGYDAWARQIAGGDWIGSEVFYQPPLYPYFLGTLYSLFGPDLLLARFCQIVIGALSCVILAAAVRRVFSPAEGLVAGLILALYAPAIFFDALIQKSVLDMFLLCLSVWLLSKLIAEPSRRLCCGLGLAMGCLGLTRENSLILVAAVFIWLFVHHRALGKQRVALVLSFAIGVTIVLLPVVVRNKVVGGVFHLTSAQFGPNFYIGNNQHADGTYVPLRYGRADVRFERQDATELAEQALRRTLSPAEVSRYWSGRAWDYIRSHPGDWLSLMARKVVLTWNAAEWEDTEDQYSYAEFSTSLRLTGYVLHLGTLTPLAVIGVWVTWQQRDKLWIFYLMLALYVAAVVIFYVFARYRYPLVPFLVIFASAALVRVRSFLQTGQKKEILACFIATAAVLVFCNWPVTSKQQIKAVTAYNLGTVLAEQGAFDQATAYFRRSLRGNPDNAFTHYNLGTALAAQGKIAESIDAYRSALRIEPDLAEAHNNLGLSLVKVGELQDAISHYQRALQIVPTYAQAHRNLGRALSHSGKQLEARKHLREAVRLEPQSVSALRSLAWLLATDSGATVSEAAEAVSFAEKAAQLTDYNDVRALDTLAAAYAAVGQFDRAVETAEAALLLLADSAQDGMVSDISQRLQRYRKGKP